MNVLRCLRNQARRVLRRHHVAFAAVLRTDRADVDDLALRQDLHAALLREPQVVLEQRVLGAFAAADHARAAEGATAALGTFAAEVRVRDLLPRLAEVHAHGRASKGIFDTELATDVPQEFLPVALARHLLHTEHSLGRVVVRREHRRPVVQLAPLRIGEEFRARTVERVGVDRAAAADGRAADDECVLERRHAEDASQTEEGRPQPASQLPRRRGVVLVPMPSALLQHADAVTLLREPQCRDAAAESGSDDQPVVVEAALSRLHVAPSAAESTLLPRRRTAQK